MSRKVVSSLVGSSLLLTACAVLGTACGTAEGNGRDGILSFQISPIPQGLTGTLYVQNYVACGKSLECTKHDFAGTTIEVIAPAGLEVAETRLELGGAWDEQGYYVDLRCNDAAAGELTVKISAGGSVRYTDRTDIACVKAAKVEWGWTIPASWPVAIGFSIEASVKVTGADGTELGGAGWKTDADGPVSLTSGVRPNHFVLEAVRAGEGKLLGGGLETPIPFKVLPDDGWELRGVELEKTAVDASNGNRATWRAVADARDPADHEVDLGDVEFTLTAAGQTETQTGFVAIFGLPDGQGGRVCAKYRGREACSDIVP